MPQGISIALASAAGRDDPQKAGVEIPGSRFRLKDQAAADIAIHNNHRRRLQPQMPYAIVFLDGRLCRKPLPVDEPFADVGIHGEIADLKGR
jgi:hypothetical protein